MRSLHFLCLLCFLHVTFSLNILFIGNSYIYSNSVDQIVKTMITEGTGATPNVIRYAVGGRKLSDHLYDMRTEGSELWGYIFGNESNYQWDYIILQEQSEMALEPPGDFNTKAQQTKENLELIMTTIFGRAGKNPQLLLFQTWGRRDDYLFGQDNLIENFDLLVEYFKEIEHWRLNITRCGEAWRLLYNDSVVHGEPMTSFVELYQNDGSHPSYKGAFLNALVMYKSITGMDPRDLTYKPAQLTECVIAYLKNASVGEMVDTVPCHPVPTETTSSTSSSTSSTSSSTTSSTSSSTSSSTTSLTSITSVTTSSISDESTESIPTSTTSYTTSFAESEESTLSTETYSNRVTSTQSQSSQESGRPSTTSDSQSTHESSISDEIIDEPLNPQLYMIIGIAVGFTLLITIISVVICVLKANQNSRVVDHHELDTVVDF